MIEHVAHREGVKRVSTCKSKNALFLFKHIDAILHQRHCRDDQVMYTFLTYNSPYSEYNLYTERGG